MLADEEKRQFRTEIYTYYESHGRDMPWRRTTEPYHIVVSEIMLQQTQVERVTDKYWEFLHTFPHFRALAAAELRDVLAVWKGLGYNRRALALKSLAAAVVDRFGGILPSDRDLLVTLPGVGEATAGAIMAYAFNLPVTFIETNIRRVFIHRFFGGREEVRDRDIMPLVEETLDRNDPRRWYWALMDYGSMLKKTVENPNKKSAHYQKQSPLRGSDREIRGAVLGLLVAEDRLSVEELCRILGADRVRADRIMRRLAEEGLVKEAEGLYAIA
jgi:A/G-specific adenine glycosylase